MSVRTKEARVVHLITFHRCTVPIHTAIHPQASPPTLLILLNDAMQILIQEQSNVLTGAMKIKLGFPAPLSRDLCLQLVSFVPEEVIPFSTRQGKTEDPHFCEADSKVMFILLT